MTHGRIMVVDDEAEIRKAVRLILTHAHYEVIEAEDGAQAIATITSGDNPRTVDVVICDLYMPKGNGTQAIAAIHSQFPAIPIIVLTGKPEVPNVVAMFKQGVVDYLLKPVTPEGLLAAVSNAMKDRHQRKGQSLT